jgi:O-antigen/teichoic acid export membrane protein
MASILAGARPVLRDSALVAPSYIVPGLVSFVLVGLLFTLLGAAGYGVWALMFAVASGVPLLTTSATESLILRYRHRGPKAIDPRAIPVSLLATTLVAAVAGALLLPRGDPASIAATSVLSLSIGTYFIRVAQLRADLRFGSASILASTRAIAGGALAVLGAWIAGPVGGATGMAVGFLASIALSTWRTRGPDASAPPDPIPVSDQRAYGMASMVIAVALFILSVGDRFILSVFRPLEDVGVYAAVYTIVDLIIRLAPSVVTVAIRTPLFRAWDMARSQMLTAWVGSLFAVVLWGSSVVSAVLTLTAALWLQHPTSQALVAPIAFGLTAGAVAMGLTFLYAASEMQVRLAALVVVSAALSIGLNVALVPSSGPQGSALATLISFGTLLALCVAGLGRSVIPTRSELAIWILCTAAAGSAVTMTGPMWLAAGFLVLCLVPLRVTVWRSLHLPTELAAPGRIDPAAMP